jgi:hypothetical protein
MRKIDFSFDVELQKIRYILPDFAKGNKEIVESFNNVSELKPDFSLTPSENLLGELKLGLEYQDLMIDFIQKKLVSLGVQDICIFQMSTEELYSLKIMGTVDVKEEIERLESIFVGLVIHSLIDDEKPNIIIPKCPIANYDSKNILWTFVHVFNALTESNKQQFANDLKTFLTKPPEGSTYTSMIAFMKRFVNLTFE